MSTEDLYQIERISDQVAMIFCTTYVNPISYLSRIEKDLSKQDFDGEILFDLLLANGCSSNRFVQAEVKEGKIDRSSAKVIEHSCLGEALLEKVREFHVNHSHLIEKSNILTEEEKYNLLNF